MGKLKVLADGKSIQARASARGKLFEKLMAEVLRHYGYSIDRIANVNYAGMEIDIDGRNTVTGTPLYAECKCQESEVTSPKLQEFFGKYMAQWLKDSRSQGLFIALPGINSHAKGFYNENCEQNSKITVRLLEEERVLEAIFATPATENPDAIAKKIPKELGTPGDWLLLYTDQGLFWVQYVIPLRGGFPEDIALFDASGLSLSDKPTLDYLLHLDTGLNDFNLLTLGSTRQIQPTSVPQEVEQIVEVRGSSECFEYQFPASPEYFVGRQSILSELDSFVVKVIDKETSSRGLLFEANSGWGKSSVVLASVDRLNKSGHFAVAIDSRSAISSQFILRVVEHALGKFGTFNDLFSQSDQPTTISGFEGVVKSLLRVGQILESHRKVLFIFLDQFENVFFLPETIKRITDLLLKVCDAQTNVVLGFSWKTDLVGLTSEFPFRQRDSIATSSRHIALETFSDVETTALLERLSQEIRAPLRKDLIFFLSEFSQGYPWLLKKLCAHVKSQREAGVPQSDIANSLLNVEELFQEDLRGLSPEENDALLRIARAAPISISELGEDLKLEVVQTLVHRRLVVSIGNKFDVYWDIFRDYLNFGRVPVQENYILRVQAGSILKAMKILTEAPGTLDIVEFQRRAGLSEKSFYNLARDMRLLGLTRVEQGIVILREPFSKEQNSQDLLRSYLAERLRRNRLVSGFLAELESRESLTITEMAKVLTDACPYISATQTTWLTYARTFADWMDFSDLAIFDSGKGELARYQPGREIRERRLTPIGRRKSILVPSIQYTPVERAALILARAIQKKDSRISWEGLKRSTIAKSLRTLEDLELIVRKSSSIEIRGDIARVMSDPDQRVIFFAERVSRLGPFSDFLGILEQYKHTGCPVSKLAKELKSSLGVDWKISTAETHTKIMLDWARHTRLAPGVFSKSSRQKKDGSQMGLFADSEAF